VLQRDRGDSLLAASVGSAENRVADWRRIAGISEIGQHP
jgi:hypothetical protein